MVMLILCAAPIHATTRIVPDDQPGIQSAIEASASSDTVLVRPGTYVENLDFLGKDVVVLSMSGPEATVIRGASPPNPDKGSTVFMADCGDGAELSGFTLQEGSGMTQEYTTYTHGRAGGGVCIVDSRERGPMIKGNVIVHNTGYGGAGIYLGGSGRIIENLIMDNTGTLGAGIYLDESGTPTSSFAKEVTGNSFVGNHGGGVSLRTYFRFRQNVVACNEQEGACLFAVGSPQGSMIEGNTVFGNWSRDNLGVVTTYVGSQNQLVFRANAVVFNFGGAVACLWEPGLGLPEFGCNDIHGNTPWNEPEADCGPVLGVNGNFDAEPLFGSAGCPPTTTDFCVTAESPLLPENSPPGCGLVGAKDLCPWTGIAGAGVSRGPLSVLAPSPNPFSLRSTIAFSLPQSCMVDASIYGILGRRVRTLLAGVLPAGSHAVEWDGRGDDGERVASGVYVAVIRAGGREAARTLLFIR